MYTDRHKTQQQMNNDESIKNIKVIGDPHSEHTSSSSTSGGAGGWKREEGWREGEREEERSRAKLPAAGEPGPSDASPAQSPHHARELPLPALQTGNNTQVTEGMNIGVVHKVLMALHINT